ncbi:MAG: M15 family metallopeptidase [Paludibacter sp.]|nr:M15 family metallopeptidase [Paludibacter sp.]
MRFFVILFDILLLIIFTSCWNQNETGNSEIVVLDENDTNCKVVEVNDTTIQDCNYTFEEAIKGTNAPIEIINQLQLVNVHYYSTDGKIHVGQVLTNKKIANEIIELFTFMFQEQFPVAKANPIVKYNWNDNLSMKDNNTYSFCYRNISYSKHAQGMAIDINPFFNPMRSKIDSLPRPNKPIGAKFDPSVPGTLYSTHPVVIKLKNMGFKWGHYYKRNYDDHHFEK